MKSCTIVLQLRKNFFIVKCFLQLSHSCKKLFLFLRNFCNRVIQCLITIGEVRLFLWERKIVLHFSLQISRLVFFLHTFSCRDNIDLTYLQAQVILDRKTESVPNFPSIWKLWFQETSLMPKFFHAEFSFFLSSKREEKLCQEQGNGSFHLKIWDSIYLFNLSSLIPEPPFFVPYQPRSVPVLILDLYFWFIDISLALCFLQFLFPVRFLFISHELSAIGRKKLARANIFQLGKRTAGKPHFAPGIQFDFEKAFPTFDKNLSGGIDTILRDVLRHTS